MHPSSYLPAPDYSKLHHFTSGSMTNISRSISAPVPSSTKPISCPTTPSHSQQHSSSHYSPTKNQSFMNTPYRHGSGDHTHSSRVGHVTTGPRGSSGQVMASSSTKNTSLSPSSIQGSVVGGRVSPSPSLLSSYKPRPTLSTKFVNRDCSLSESSFTESCTNINHVPTSLQSNV